MNLQQLEYALSLEKYGSFTRASQMLGVTQPALSAQVKNLEKEIGISLFDRSQSQIVPTERGLKFLVKAGEIVNAGKQLKEYALTLGSENEGQLRLGIIPTLSPFLVPLFIDEMLERYPKVHVEIYELLTEQVLQQIRMGELDGGIISTPIQRQGIQVRPLFFESFYLYTNGESAPDRIAANHVNTRDLWLLEEGNCFRDQVNDICAFRERPETAQLRYMCSSIDSLIRMVDHFGGATILPELTTLSLDAEQEQRLTLLEDKVREVGFVTRKLTGKEDLIDITCQSICSSIPASLSLQKGREVVDPGIKKEW